MYIRPVHAELDTAVLYPFIRSFPLGLLTTSIVAPKTPTLHTSHIPFILDTPNDGPARLRAHMARANPQAKSILSALNDRSELDDEVLVLFNAPVNHYVTPKFYAQTKPDTGKVVPTWNYAAVQVYGKMKVHHAGAEGAAFLQQQVEELSEQSERAQGYDRPWKVSDAPEKYVEILKKAIIGMEIEVTRIEGRWKVSQEMQDGDWRGVVAGFEGLGTEAGREMAELVASRGKDRDAQSNL
jgi:predicted FMN-binding regulatory protein PaiB